MTAPAADVRDGTGITTSLTLLFATATGLVVANLYYSQPLLHLVSEQLGVSSAAAGLIVTVGQLGYAAGLLLIVPAGDLVQRRPLIVGLLCICATALVGVALAPGLAMVLLAIAVVGFTAVAAQVLLPLAADLARDDQRGVVVGTVMGGLLLGILLARTVSGLVADAVGWRALYGIAAAVTFGLALVLARVLPARTRTVDSDYRSILRSLLTLIARYRALRVRTAYGVLVFAAFSIFWTTVAFLLTSEPYGYSTSVVGLFGLIGAAGALSANGAGRLADRGHVRVPTGLFAIALTASFGLLWWGRSSLAGLVIGILVLDIAVQGIHVLNFSVIYALDPQARSRLNSAYLTIYFLGGALGSLAAAWSYERWGWGGVCVLGAGTGVASLLLWLTVDRPATV